MRELRQWFARMSAEMHPGDTLFPVRDRSREQGRGRPLDNGTINLWNESLSLLEFRALSRTCNPASGSSTS